MRQTRSQWIAAILLAVLALGFLATGIWGFVIRGQQTTQEAMARMRNYAVLHGHARLTEGGAPQLLQALAPRFLGEGVKFPPMDDPPAGRIVHIAVDRVTGNGPWV